MCVANVISVDRDEIATKRYDMFRETLKSASVRRTRFHNLETSERHTVPCVLYWVKIDIVTHPGGHGFCEQSTSTPDEAT